MISDLVATKKIIRSGSSMMININDLAKIMDLQAGDVVKITLEKL